MNALLSLLLTLLLLGACSQPEAEKTPDADVSQAPVPSIAVTILPQRWLVQQLIGTPSKILVMVPPGSSPETYSPGPQQMIDLAGAELYVRIGQIPLELAWLEKFSSSTPSLKVVDPSRNIEFISSHIHSHASDAHSHHHESDHNHPPVVHGIDPHIWLSPTLMIRYSQALAPLLSEKYPDRAPAIKDNLLTMTAQLEKLDQEMRELLKSHKGKDFMVFHPAWTYFARDYGLRQWAIEDEGKSPSPRQLKKITDMIRNKGIKTLFIQNQFERRSAEAIADTLGITVIELDPLLEDWPAMLMNTARAIAASFKE